MGALFLQKPYAVSSASMVLSEMFLPLVKVVWFGEISSLDTLASLSTKILVIKLYIKLTLKMGLKSPMSDAVGVFGIRVMNVCGFRILI